MCGIAGFAGENQENIARMVSALKERGPDAQASLTTHGASIGTARLAILDPSAQGNQPLWNEDHTVVITYNGEIFNYRRLKEEEKFACRTGTDTEVILKLYERYGMGFLSRLKGMFAFGLYDTKTKTWHLARDTSGILPLFVAYPGGKLHFASITRALMKVMPEKPALNMHALSLYMRLQYVPGPETLLHGIEALPPGTHLSWQEGKEKRSVFKANVDAPSFSSKEDFKERFPAMMDEVVADHLIADRPIGIFLSGGMDSSIVLHHMCNHAPKPVRTFTVRFEATKEEDEERFNRDANLAKETAKHYGTSHTEVLLTAENCREIYSASARALDQPNADSTAMAQFLLAREAKKQVDVVLCGAGGDELFGGYPRYRIVRALNAIEWLPVPLRRTIAVCTGYPPDVLAMSPGAALAERLLTRSNKEVQEVVRGGWFQGERTTSLFQEHFKNLQSLDSLRAMMKFDRGLWLVFESLRLIDAMTLGNGLEARVPFLDPRIIAASHATPSSWHVTLQKTKALLKETYSPILPSHLFTLDKASFFPPLAKWLRRECAPLVEETLEHPRMREFFDMEKMRELFEEHKTHKRYALHTLSTLMQLRCWFEEIYDS
jgi:asparagine synthase (glutamine-hydrolysing)